MTLTKGDLQAIENIVEKKTRHLATKDEVNGIVKNEVAPLATKQELSKLATKEEISKLATKEEISKLATKEEISKLATKEEISKLATKKDLQKIDKKFDRLFDFLDKDVMKVKRDVKQIQDHLRLTPSEF